MMLRLSAALALGALQLARAQPAEDIGKLVLDEQQLNFTGTLFDTERWAGYVRCMRQASEGAGFSIYEVEEAGWRGFVEYGLSNGSRSDPWDPDLGDPRRGGWLEYNPQPMAKDDRRIPGASRITITEPCNYVSNVAYYTSMTTMCSHDQHANWTMPQRVVDLLVASFATLASGSSFLHASGTNLGGTMDTTPIGHISLAAYQAAVSSLSPQPYIADVRALPTEPGHNGTDEIEAVCRLMERSSVYLWNEEIKLRRAEYQSNYYLTFGAIVVLGARLGVEKDVADLLLPLAARVMGLSEFDIEFLLERFDPNLQRSLAEAAVDVPLADKTVLIRRSLGMLLKMFYAFFWQEGTFKGEWLKSPEANELGASLIPGVNLLGDGLTGYWHPLYVRASLGVYPGNAECKKLVAHAKWHEQSANALVDLIFLTDDMHKLILGQPLSTARELDEPKSGREGFVRAAERGCFDAFADKEGVGAMLAEMEGAVQCLEAGTHYDSAKGVDTRLACLSRWAFGREQDTMDACLLHNGCLGLRADAAVSSALSFGKIQRCATAACAAHLPTSQRVPLALCVTACPRSPVSQEPDFVCAAQCLAGRTHFSPAGAALVHCAAHLAPSKDTTFQTVTAVATCMGEQLAPRSNLWAAVGRSGRCSAEA